MANTGLPAPVMGGCFGGCDPHIQQIPQLQQQAKSQAQINLFQHQTPCCTNNLPVKLHPTFHNPCSCHLLLSAELIIQLHLQFLCQLYIPSGTYTLSTRLRLIPPKSSHVMIDEYGRFLETEPLGILGTFDDNTLGTHGTRCSPPTASLLWFENLR